MSGSRGKMTETADKVTIRTKDSPGDNPFTVERYKYLLQEMRSLNENVYKHLTLFQTLATAVIGASTAVLVSWKKLDVGPDIARITIWTLACLLFVLAMFTVLSIASGMLAWFDYRKEEVVLLDRAVYPGFRKSPTLRNLLHWQETYVILFVLSLAAGGVSFVYWIVMPAMG